MALAASTSIASGVLTVTVTGKSSASNTLSMTFLPSALTVEEKNGGSIVQTTITYPNSTTSDYTYPFELDANGYSIIPPSTDSQVIYVSVADGNATNDGLTTATPVATWQQGYAKLRNGYPDRMLFKKGETFTTTFSSAWEKNGRSQTEPMMVGAYGTGERPIIDTGSDNGVQSDEGSSNVAFIGIKFYASERNPAVGATHKVGLAWLDPTSTKNCANILIEDCAFQNYGSNITIQSQSSHLIPGVIVRKNVIVDAWNLEDRHSQGIFLSSCINALVEDNVADHNGWSESGTGSVATAYNHNFYVTSESTGLVFRRNITARASETGIQQRGGGLCKDNLFVQNKVHLTFGLMNGGSGLTAGGVYGDVSGNAVDLNRGSHSYGSFVFGNTRPISDGGGTYCHDNLFINGSENGGALMIGKCDGSQPNYTTSLGACDIVIDSNIVYGCSRGVIVDDSVEPGTTGPTNLTGFVVQNNDIQGSTDSVYGGGIRHLPVFSSDNELFVGNAYSGTNPSDSSGGFSVASTITTFAEWKLTVEPTATSVLKNYIDPTRNVAKYAAYIGLDESVAAFLTACRGQSKDNYDPDLTAEAAIAWIRAGFQEVA